MRTEKLQIVIDASAPEGTYFVDVETFEGKSVSLGEWRKREDGMWSIDIEVITKPKDTELLDACRDMLEMWDLICPKVNWGASFLDAVAIKRFNEAPLQLREAITKEDATDNT